MEHIGNTLGILMKELSGYVTGDAESDSKGKTDNDECIDMHNGLE